jgi:hypothetical protein
MKNIEKIARLKQLLPNIQFKKKPEISPESKFTSLFPPSLLSKERVADLIE